MHLSLTASRSHQVSISLRGSGVGSAFCPCRIYSKQLLGSSVVDWRALCLSLQMFLIASYKFVLQNVLFFGHCGSLDRADEWCHQISFLLDEGCAAAAISMQVLGKVPSCRHADLHFTLDSISTSNCALFLITQTVKGWDWNLRIHLDSEPFSECKFRSLMWKKGKRKALIHCVAYSIM